MTASAAKSRPVMFAGPLVPRIRTGLKTGTRRPMSPQPMPWRCNVPGMGDIGGLDWKGRRYEWDDPHRNIDLAATLGKPGDRLYLRETWRTWERPSDGVDGILFRADDEFVPIENTREAAERWMEAHHLKPRPDEFKAIKGASEGLKVAMPRRAKGWRPAIHMPRWASRIELELTGVQAEQLQDITEAEAIKEGFARDGKHSARDCFAHLWDQFYGAVKGLAWSANPWVFAYTFRLIKGGI